MAKPRVQLRPYRDGDLAAFTPRADFAEELAATGWNWAGGAPSAQVYTVIEGDGAVIGVAGFVPQAAGEWHAFAYLAEIPRRLWPQLLWRAETALRRLEFLGGARRIFASARMSCPAARPTLARLCFEETAETIEAAIGEGVGYDIMVRGAR